MIVWRLAHSSVNHVPRQDIQKRSYFSTKSRILSKTKAHKMLEIRGDLLLSLFYEKKWQVK